MEGFQSELAEFAHRKTNSWRAPCLLCLSQGCNINFPTVQAGNAEEMFCELGAFPPVCMTHVWPHPGKSQAAALWVRGKTVAALWALLEQTVGARGGPHDGWRT